MNFDSRSSANLAAVIREGTTHLLIELQRHHIMARIIQT